MTSRYHFWHNKVLKEMGMSVNADLMNQPTLFNSKGDVVDVLWFYLVKVKNEVAEAAVFTVHSLSNGEVRRSILTTESFDLVYYEHSFRVSHNLGHGGIEVNKPLKTEFLQLAQSAQLNGDVSEQIMVQK